MKIFLISKNFGLEIPLLSNENRLKVSVYCDKSGNSVPEKV